MGKDKKSKGARLPMSQNTPPWRDLSHAERHAILDTILITYRGFTDLLDELDYRNLYTQSGATHNPPCLAILGATGAGKTKLVEEWLARNNNQRTETPTGSHIPYLYVSVPAKASMKGTAAAFLSTLGDPNPGRGTQWNMVTRLHTLLKSCHVRMIFVDEFQHILDRDTQHVLHAVSDFLKDIINQSAIPMILIGQPGEAEPILLTNPQLSRRVGSPRYLKPFLWNRAQPQTIIEFCTIMESIDHALPFDLSGLASKDMAYRFHYASDGYLGWIMPLIREAARLAIKERCPTLNRILLQQAYENCIAGSVLGTKKKNPFASEHFI
jgi:Bacterial TniB protein